MLLSTVHWPVLVHELLITDLQEVQKLRMYVQKQVHQYNLDYINTIWKMEYFLPCQ